MKFAPRQGTYEASLGDKLLRAREILRTHEFFSVNYDDSPLVTDVPRYRIAVRRCGVTTDLNWPATDDRPDIAGLFDDMDALVKDVQWRKASDRTDSLQPLLRSRTEGFAPAHPKRY
jgi:hypothetical protein